MASGDLIPSDHDRPEPPSLEVEFALVLARMMDTLKNNPQDMRQALYELARYKLREQLPDVDAWEKERTQQALETAIRGIEAFSEQRVGIFAPALYSQLNGPVTTSASDTLFPTELTPHVGPRSHLRMESEGNASGPKHTRSPWPHLRRAAVVVAILIAILVAVQQRGRLVSMADNLPKLERNAAIEERSAPLQVSNQPVPNPPPAKPPLRPTDYGVYAISNDALIGLSLLSGRPPDIRVAVSAPLTTPSRTILRNGHPKFIVFRRDLPSSVADRAEVRIIARIAREFSAGAVSMKPSDDSWVMRNISFPFRLSPVNDNSDMYELHSEDPALELTPGRYALVLKTQAYDFSVEGEVVDPKQCIERIVASNGTFYSDCKRP